MTTHETSELRARRELETRLSEKIREAVWNKPNHPVCAAFLQHMPNGTFEDFCDWLPGHLAAMKKA